MRIFSLQSWVTYGHVGNAAVLFPLQRLGAEVLALNTTQLSNHLGYPDAPGAATLPATIRAITTGLEHRGALGTLDGVLTGYLGGAAVAEAVLDAVARAKQASSRALYCCDPVLGDDDGGLYVAADLPDFVRSHALPLADVATPNAFELALLTGISCPDLAAVKRALAALSASGPREVVLTGYRGAETPAESLDLVLADASGHAYLLRTPRLELGVHGTGDLFAALYLFYRLTLGDAVAALESAASSLFGVIRRTVEARTSELLLVAAQDELVHPERRFRAQAC